MDINGILVKRMRKPNHLWSPTAQAYFNSNKQKLKNVKSSQKGGLYD